MKKIKKEDSKDEFNLLEEYVKANIVETYNEGMENSQHNRYKDILPYDSNRLILTKMAGISKKNLGWQKTLIQYNYI